MKNRKILSAILSLVLVAATALSMSGCSSKETASSSSSEAVSSEAEVSEESSEVSEETESSEESSEVSEESETSEESSEESSEEETADESDSNASSEKEVLGEGSTVFDFTVVDTDGNETYFEIHTDKTTVGDALTELGLIEGEDSEYGLYVKTVNGIKLDYDTDGKYWAFYVNGEYASTGVDSTDVEAGAEYTFKGE